MKKPPFCGRFQFVDKVKFYILYKPPSDEGGGPLAVEGENGNFVANGLDKP
jgi:hypothetical protein